MEHEVRDNLDAERAAEKQADREADERDVREGRKSAAQVNRDNSLAHGVVQEFRMRLRLGVR